MNKPWCIYSTSHPTGLYYQGKGKTALVKSGKYTGSGVRYNLALTIEEFAPGTWTTTILDTFDTEDEAYLAEEALVTHLGLANPFCLNMMQGGRRGKYKTPSSLLRQFKSEQKKVRARETRAKQRAKLDALKAKATLEKAAAALKLKAAQAGRVGRIPKQPKS